MFYLHVNNIVTKKIFFVKAMGGGDGTKRETVVFFREIWGRWV